MAPFACKVGDGRSWNPSKWHCCQISLSILMGIASPTLCTGSCLAFLPSGDALSNILQRTQFKPQRWNLWSKTSLQPGRGHTFARENNVYEIWSFLRASWLRNFDISHNLGVGTLSRFLFNPYLPTGHFLAPKLIILIKCLIGILFFKVLF